MGFLNDLFNYHFLTNAALAAVLAGVACGIVGTYIVARRLVFMSGGVTHASFGGIGLAYYLGINPVGGALVFAVASALGVERLARRGRVSEDTAAGVLWGVGMAIGVIFIFLTPGYAPNLMSFLFGNILMVTSDNLLGLFVLDVILIGLMRFGRRAIVYAAFDREFAQAGRLPVGTIGYGMMVLIAVTIVLNIKTMGIILLMSLLTMPVVIAGLMSREYGRMTVLACVIGTVGVIVGLYASYTIDVPAGASAVGVLAFLYIGIWLVRWLKRLLSKRLHHAN